MLSWWCYLEFIFNTCPLFKNGHIFRRHTLLLCMLFICYWYVFVYPSITYIINNYPKIRSFYSRKMTFLTSIFLFQKKIVRYFDDSVKKMSLILWITLYMKALFQNCNLFSFFVFNNGFAKIIIHIKIFVNYWILCKIK